MSDMEERLRAALAARADLVHEEDLAPLPAPQGGPAHRVWWHSGRSWLSVAAVAAIVVAIPLLVSTLTSDPDGVGPAGPAGSPSADSQAPDKVEHTFVASETERGDLDGDGEDEVVLLSSTGATRHPDEVWVDAELPGDGTPRWDLPLDRAPASLVDVADVDGHGGEEVLLETGAGPKVLVVLTLVADGNAFAVLSDDEIKSGTGPEGFRHAWWVDADGLVSTVSVRPLTDEDEVYAVDAFRWEPRQGLTPVELGRFCVRDERPQRLRDSCDELDAGYLPAEDGGL